MCAQDSWYGGLLPPLYHLATICAGGLYPTVGLRPLPCSVALALAAPVRALSGIATRMLGAAERRFRLHIFTTWTIQSMLEQLRITLLLLCTSYDASRC